VAWFLASKFPGADYDYEYIQESRDHRPHPPIGPKGDDRTGKGQKKILGPKLIPRPGYSTSTIPEVQVWTSGGRSRYIEFTYEVQASL
jgi:hypothetical protein